MFWIVLGAYMFTLAVILAIWLPLRQKKVSLLAFNLCIISILLDLSILLVAIIQVNKIIRENYPKLKIRQWSSIIHIAVGILAMANIIWFNFGNSANSIFPNILYSFVYNSFDFLTAWILY